MLDFKLCLSLPGFLWSPIYRKSGPVPGLKNKLYEVDVQRCSHLLNVDFITRIMSDHAGVSLTLGLFTYQIIVDLYDPRTWPYST